MLQKNGAARNQTTRSNHVQNKSPTRAIFAILATNMYHLIAIGDTKLDTFVVLDQASVQCQLKMPDCLLCLEYGAKIPVSVVDSQVAGSAPNVAVGLARQGLKTAVISNMGKDNTLDLAVKHLKTEGVDTRYLHVSKNEPSSYSVVLNFKGDRTILTSHIGHTYHLPAHLPKTLWVHVGEMGHGYEPIYKSLAARARSNGLKVSFNPGSIQLQEKDATLFELIKETDVLFVNREEARAITGSSSIEIHHLAPGLRKLGCQEVVITDGKHGAYHFDGKAITFCPIFPGTAVETTGAGDAFATGFLGARLEGLSTETSLKWGSVNSASVVAYVGPTKGLLSQAQIKTRLQKAKSFTVKTF